ncbi:recombinase family protein, partial [Falseniella ignava]
HFKFVTIFFRHKMTPIKLVFNSNFRGSPHTMDSKGEVLITIMASLAQQESESMSKNIKMGLRYRYQNGVVEFGTSNFLGYDMNENDELVINEEQAKVVRRIFKEYLEGSGTGQIAKGLMKDGILTGAGNKKWLGEDINRIISNEKYMGDVLLQKTYTVDCLTKQRIKNDGKVPQYYIEDNHEPIVSKEIFHLAQQEKAKRSNVYTGKKNTRRLHHGKYALSGIVRCEHCGDIYRRVKWNSRGSKATVWRCVTRIDNYRKCNARNIKEEELHQIVLDALNRMIDEKESYLKIMDSIISKIIVDDHDEKVERLNDKLRTLQETLILAANQDKDYEKIADQIFELRTKKEKLLIENVANQEKRRRLADIKAYLKTQHTKLEEYKESLVTRIVEQILIKDESVEVTLKCGKIITVEK